MISTERLLDLGISLQFQLLGVSPNEFLAKLNTIPARSDAELFIITNLNLISVDSRIKAPETLSPLKLSSGTSTMCPFPEPVI